MFPFLWWLGEETQPALPTQGGGDDFIRRRAIASVGQTTWDPARLNPLFWLIATNYDVRIDADPDVVDWRSRGTDLQRIAASGSLNWQPNGWGSGKPSPHYSLAGGGPFLTTATGTVISQIAGSDAPFSAMFTLQAEAVADQVFCCWDDTTPGTSAIIVRINNAGGGKLRFTRVDAAAASVTVDGNLDIGTGKQRVGVSFTGTSVSLFVGRSFDVSAACDVGSLSLNRFRVGTGPLIDAFTGLMPEMVVVPRAISIAEWMAYYDSSVRRLG